MTKDQQEPTEEIYLLRKSDFLKIFNGLKRWMPHINAMMREAPKDVCYIMKVDDDLSNDFVYLSVAEFFQKIDAIHENDEFILTLVGYFTRDELKRQFPNMELDGYEITGRMKAEYDDPEGFSRRALVKDFNPMLVNWCLIALLNNKPLGTNLQQIVDKYNLKAPETEKLMDLIEICNHKAIAELQAQFDKLKVIDWIKK